MVCTAPEMIDRLKLYEEADIDDFIMNVNVGHSQQESLDAVNRFAVDVMPWFNARPQATRTAAIASG